MATSDDSDAIAASLHEPARFAAVLRGDLRLPEPTGRSRAGRGAASETFVRAFGARAGYDPAYPDARPWLYGIANNLLRKHARTEERRRRAYARALERDGVCDDGLDAIPARVDASAGAR